jgi:hypothetical protein
MTFEPTDATRLLELVHERAASNFLPDPRGIQPPAGATQYAVYNDASTHRKLEEQVASGKPKNIWVYTGLEVHNHHFGIERGYGGGGMPAETDLIEFLARSPELTLVKWNVLYGGQGYGGGTFAEGEGADSLLKYLAPVPLPSQRPDFACIEKALRGLLLLTEPRDIFELAHFEAGEWMCRAVVLYKHDTSDIIREQTWQNSFAGSEPHRQQVEKIGRTVTYRCDVPGRVVRSLSDHDEVIATRPGAPEIKYFKQLGFVLQFGYSMKMGFYDHADEFPEN